MDQQFVDPNVSRSKFEREMGEFHALFDTYRARGWFLIREEYPTAIVVLAAPQLTPPAIVMGVAFDYTNYDAVPPSVRIVNPFTGTPLKLSELPTPLNRAVSAPDVQLPGMPAGARMQLLAAQPYMQAHSAEDIPFFCVAGVREYHEHPAHSGDAWELHRPLGAGRLVRLIDIIYKYGISPITGYGVQLVPQVGLSFGPPPA